MCVCVCVCVCGSRGGVGGERGSFVCVKRSDRLCQNNVVCLWRFRGSIGVCERGVCIYGRLKGWWWCGRCVSEKASTAEGNDA